VCCAVTPTPKDIQDPTESSRTWRMNSALALRSSGVAMATKRSRLSSPSAMYAQRRIDRMHLAAAMPLFATRILRIGRLPPWLCPTKFQPRLSLQSSAARAREARAYPCESS